MIEDCNAVVAEMELKKFTLINSRERYRKAYDNAINALTLIEGNLKENPKNERFLEDKKSAERSRDHSKKVIDALERELNGGLADPKDPNDVDVQGVDPKLQEYADRISILKEFIRLNC